jgi:hypothetical protein
MLASGASPGSPVVRRLADSLRRLTPAASATVLPVLLCPSPATLRQALAGAKDASSGDGGHRGDSSGDTFADGGGGAVRGLGTEGTRASGSYGT